MSSRQGSFTCTATCWLVALFGGVLAAALLMVLGGWSFIQAVFAGVVLFALLGALLGWILCRPLPGPRSVAGPGDRVPTTTYDARAASGAGASGAASASGLAASSVGGQGAAAASAGDELPSGAVMDAAAGDTATHAEGPGASASGTANASDTPGNEEGIGAATHGAQVQTGAGDEGTAAQGQGTAAGAAAAGVAGIGGYAASAALPGEAELAARKGTWRYGGGDDTSSDAGSGTGSGAGDSSGAHEAHGAAATGAHDDLPAPSDADKPATLDAPRDGGPDDLKRIKGVGPKLEGLLHSLGFFHFDQVASWTANEVAWVDHNLEGFKGRVTRDEWVSQARLLASGGETEFSQRVDKGGVYE